MNNDIFPDMIENCGQNYRYAPSNNDYNSITLIFVKQFSIFHLIIKINYLSLPNIIGKYVDIFTRHW